MKRYALKCRAVYGRNVMHYPDQASRNEAAAALVQQGHAVVLIDRTEIELLRAAVAARIAYWDALGALEQELCPDDISDRASDRLHEFISDLAAGGEPHQVGEEHLARVIEIASWK